MQMNRLDVAARSLFEKVAAAGNKEAKAALKRLRCP
jgi:hypothetical protein